ncbi:hypothetical protein, partial [Bradyrhizobium sp. Leo170]|uniref:hypothetical protein n=1 Tax=Bradyrhizobium sp. Leo170 TaxID=1571199 RepID=UPI001A91E6D5
VAPPRTAPAEAVSIPPTNRRRLNRSVRAICPPREFAKEWRQSLAHRFKSGHRGRNGCAETNWRHSLGITRGAIPPGNPVIPHALIPAPNCIGDARIRLCNIRASRADGHETRLLMVTSRRQQRSDRQPQTKLTNDDPSRGQCAGSASILLKGSPRTNGGLESDNRERDRQRDL